MSALAISDAPPIGVPLRFVMTASLWGCFAGGWIAGQGSEVSASRWAPATVALVHALALGVIGNAMLGALTQFLPVAAGTRLACARSVPVLHAVFNTGLAVFVFAMARMFTPAMPWAAALLGGSLIAFAMMAGVSLWRGSGARWLRGGIGWSLIALAITAAMGMAALLALSGRLTLPLVWWIDVHAASGIVGSVLGLIAVIGAVTLPMLQGTRSPPPLSLQAWQGTVMAGVVIGAWLRSRGHPEVLVLTTIVAAWSLAVASFWLLGTTRHRRSPTLSAFWSLGVTAVAIGAAVLVSPLPSSVDRAMLAGALVLAIGLPLIVVGMMLEIVGFLAWIHLRRVVPRGHRLPGIGGLMPEHDKRCALVAHLLASLLMLSPLLLHRGHLAAGLAMLLSWLVTLAVLLRCGRRMRRARADLTCVNGADAART